MINQVTLQGRLTKDPELKHTESGVARILFTVAWSERYKEVEKQCFLLCRAWRHTAEFICNYFAKGSEIIVTGKMVSEKWREGESTTLLAVEQAHFCGPKQGQKTEAAAQPAPDPMPAGGEFVPVPDDIEDLPFK